MESVLAAFFVMFIMIFGVLTFTDEFVSSQTAIQEAWQDMETRRDDQADTQLVILDAHTTDSGSVVLLNLQNSGAVKVADFRRWDVFIQYMDDAVPVGYHIDHLTYSPNDPTIEGWSINGIFLDIAKDQLEAYNPGILDPGETLVMHLRLAPAIGPGQAALVNISMTNGVSAAYTFVRSMPPTLTTNTGISLASGGNLAFSTTTLAATDPDNTADELIYNVTMSPAQGTLSLTTFTQADIDQNRLTYTHTGAGPDDFQFTLTDGENVVGPFTVLIMIDELPTLAVNAGLTLSANSTAPISNTALTTTDADTPADELVYTVTTLPAQGTLNQTTFTQGDIEGGLVTYTDTAATSDSFQFTVTDGTTTLGPLTFNITVN